MNLLEAPWNAVLAASLRGSALILCVLAVRGLLRGRLPAQAVHLLWLLVAVRLVMPGAPSSSWSVFNLAPRVPAIPATADAGWRVRTFVEPSGAVPGPAMVAAPVAGRPKPTGRTAEVLPWLWLAGVVVQVGLLGWSALGVRRRLGRAVVIEDGRFLQLAEECRALLGVRRRVVFLESAELAGPAVLGLWRARLVLPPGLIARLSDEELRFVLLHELAHVRRHDLAALWLLTAARVLHWFNPLTWLVAHIARGDTELACDETVLRHARGAAPTAYGAALLKLVQLAPWRPAAVPMAGIAERAGALKERLARIADYAPGTVRRAVFAGFVLLGVGVVFGAEEKKNAAPALTTTTTETPATPEVKPSEAAPPTLKNAVGQVEIEAQFIELPEALALTLKDAAGNLFFPPAPKGGKPAPVGHVVSVLKAGEVPALLAKLAQRKGTDLLGAPKVTTKSGQRAVIEIGRELRYPVGWKANKDKKGA